MINPNIELTPLTGAANGAASDLIRSERALGDAELAEAALLGRRLHAEFRGVVGLLPDEERGASAMARALGMDRATCQRIVSTLAQPDAGASTLVQFPGVMGLKQFLSAVALRYGAGAEQLASALAAVDLFETFLSNVAGSQRRLRERLSAVSVIGQDEPPAYVGSDDPAVREALFRAAADATGRCSETLVSMRLIRPTPGNRRLTEEAYARGFIGHTARARAVPLIVGHSTTHHADGAAGAPSFSTLDARPASGPTPSALVAEFCTSPLPTVVSRNAGSKVVQMIDTPGAALQGGGLGSVADIVIANREVRPEPHPATRRPAVGEVWTLVTFPARRMVFDVYLHRDLARQCVPSLELHLWNPDVGQQGASRWSTRFPGGPRLEVLGPALENASSTVYRRAPELLEHLFRSVGWPADEFVGYRCEATYPVWRAGYCMAFDFTGNEM